MRKAEHISVPSLAHDGIESLLGMGVINDDLWHDLSRFETTALPFVTANWHLATINFAAARYDHFLYRCYNQHDDEVQTEHLHRIAATLAALEQTLGTATLRRCAAAFYLHPQLWLPHYRGYHLDQLQGCQAYLLAEVAGSYLCQHTPPDWVARLCQRIATLALSVPQINDGMNSASCVGHLLARNDPTTAPLLTALTIGDWQTAWDEVVRLAGYDQSFTADRAAVERLKTNWCAGGWRCNGTSYVLVLLARLFQQQRLDSPTFRQVLAALPGSLQMVNSILAAIPFDKSVLIRFPQPYYLPHAHMSSLVQQIQATLADVDWDAFRATLQQFTDGIFWELLYDFRPESFSELWQTHYLSGGRYLLRLAEEVSRRGLERLTAGHYRWDDLNGVIVHLLGVLRRRHDDDSAQLVALLRQFSPRTLLTLLPHTSEYDLEICAALGWAGSYDLLKLLDRIEQQQPARSSDPQAGVLHRQEVVALTSQMDTEQLQMLLARLKLKYADAVLLVQAVLGWNRKELRRSFGQRNQLAARALGLLPLERPEELLERYLMLTKYLQEANSSRAGQKAYERAAAQAALTNLAHQAGFANITRLEWAMEAKLGSERTSIGRQWPIGGYTLTLVLQEYTPRIAAHNGKRLLKRMPPAVTRDYAYREVQTVLKQAREQVERYKQAFLDSMRHGQPLTIDEVTLLRDNPIASALLENLVLIDEATGACGLFRAADSSLEGIHSERIPITGNVLIAHAYTLEQAGLLADWQAEIVRRQVVQPFKQVFRELYVITPAEESAGYASARLDGRPLKSRQALAILANLGWVIDGFGLARKPFYQLGYAAHVELDEWYAEGVDSGATMGTLSFWPLQYTQRDGKAEPRIPLATVPPLIFSEVLRDLDLVTAVAHDAEEYGPSQEVLQRRGDLVQATLTAVGLTSVATIDTPFVRVRGRLANYRVHLATAAVYTETGHYICIVPNAQGLKAVYLPFAEGGESLTSEVISKVLLLANDTLIKDESILAQILSHRQQAA